jgi:GNAT superfamily N-acetyltransferase
MGTCTIGLAEGRHVDALVALFEAQLQEHSIETSQDNLRAVIEAVIADRRYGFILAATVPDGRVVGAAYASSLLSFEHGGISGWLEELYVLPQWRDQGIGSQLLAAVIAHAKTVGWRALDLEVDATHQRAVPLHTRHEFHPRSRTRFYRVL